MTTPGTNIDAIKHRARYCVYGWVTGDALGGTLEFTTKEGAKSKLIYYNNFEDGLVGAGPFRLEPGQPTDDTELGLAIMSVVHKYGFYKQDAVAEMYRIWYLSDPIDIGNATKASVSKSSLQEMITIAKTTNKTTLSNGFLMRLPGLIALYHDKSANDLIKAIAEDTILTHGHIETPHIAIIYGIMLRKAIEGASADEIYNWGKNNCQYSPLFTTLYKSTDANSNEFLYNNQIYKFSQIDSNLFGFVGFVIWLLLRCLKKHTSYKSAILDIVSCGGDTDTNACIVGAIFGALYPSTIPEVWINNILNYADKNQKRFQKYPIVNPNVWVAWLR
jgi:ADP-ribosylglycohydrolase